MRKRVLLTFLALAFGLNAWLGPPSPGRTLRAPCSCLRQPRRSAACRARARRHSLGSRLMAQCLGQPRALSPSLKPGPSTKIPPSMRRVLSCLSVFAALFALRAWDINQHFFLLGDQIRDWQVALRPFWSLPLTGPHSNLGGYSLGPIFYWVLWAIRVTLGPAFGNLPHVGGAGLAALQSAADAFLFFSLWRRVRSPWIALAAVALPAAGSFDAGMSTLIWNPGVASAIAKIAMALFLLERRGSQPMLYLTLATAWLALQAHITGLYVTVPIFGWLIGRELVGRQWRAAGDAALAAIECVLVLQIPYALYLLGTSSGELPASGALATMAGAAGRPLWLTLTRSWDAVMSRTNFLLAESWPLPAFGWIVAVAAALVCWRARRDPPLLVVTVLPLATATLVFAPWQQPETYWFLVLGPSVAMTLVLGFTTFGPPRVTDAFAMGLVAVLVVAAPARYRASQNATFFRFPNYGSLLRGSRDIVKRRPDVRDIRTSFELPPSTDRLYLFNLLGGRLNSEGAEVALIAADGSVSYDRAAR